MDRYQSQSSPLRKSEPNSESELDPDEPSKSGGCLAGGCLEFLAVLVLIAIMAVITLLFLGGGLGHLLSAFSASPSPSPSSSLSPLLSPGLSPLSPLHSLLP
jgi:hypothetical protein